MIDGRIDGQLEDWFDIITTSGRIASNCPLLFIIVMDWILSQAIDGGGGGLEWLDGHILTDLDFADDIALLDETWGEMQNSSPK